MERVFGNAALPARFRGGVVALGNFDGFHAGHQAVVGRALERARAAGRPVLVATFDPHPARLFRPDAPPFALTSIAQRLDLFEAFGIDAAVVIPFDRGFAAHSAEAFVGDWLAGHLGAAGVVTGDDFTFGRGRAGDTGALALLGAMHGVVAEVVAPVADGEGTISSTRIRALLRAGDPGGAAALLTRPFAIAGVVEAGAQLGRTLGYPTANQSLGEYLRPRYGVYAVRVRLPDGSVRPGVANLGVRPMIAPPLELLETFVFDWTGDLYGQDIAVELHHWLRDERKLPDLAALTAQMDADADRARALLAAAPAAR